MGSTPRKRSADHALPERVLERAIEEAISRFLAAVPSDQRAERATQLRREIEIILTEAPVSGDVVDDMRLRARIAAALSRL